MISGLGERCNYDLVEPDHYLLIYYPFNGHIRYHFLMTWLSDLSLETDDCYVVQSG